MTQQQELMGGFTEQHNTGCPHDLLRISFQGSAFYDALSE
jgi:hypothetical protein